MNDTPCEAPCSVGPQWQLMTCGRNPVRGLYRPAGGLPWYLPTMRETGSIPGSGRSGEGSGNPLQYSCLEDPMATVHGVAKSWTRLRDFTFLSFLSIWTVGSNAEDLNTVKGVPDIDWAISHHRPVITEHLVHSLTHSHSRVMDQGCPLLFSQERSLQGSQWLFAEGLLNMPSRVLLCSL